MEYFSDALGLSSGADAPGDDLGNVWGNSSSFPALYNTYRFIEYVLINGSVLCTVVKFNEVGMRLMLLISVYASVTAEISGL